MARNFAARAVSAAWHRKRLWLLHLVANAALAALAYSWLWIPDEHAWQVGFSLVLALLLVLAALLLHGGTLVALEDAHADPGAGAAAGFRRALRHLAPLLLWLVVTVLLIRLVLSFDEQAAGVAGYLHSKLPAALRARIAPDRAWEWMSTLVSLLAWGLVPLVLLPFGMQFASRGFGRAALRNALRGLVAWRYWVAFIVLFGLGAGVPCQLVWWLPVKGSVGVEAASMSVRFGVAYLIAITAWLLLASVLGLASATKSLSAPPAPPPAT